MYVKECYANSTKIYERKDTFSSYCTEIILSICPGTARHVVVYRNKIVKTIILKLNKNRSEHHDVVIFYSVIRLIRG